ncbi:nicotinate phosphoribosyltransferase [Candidatus Contubernalis alkaliaceticus]|uniref:nicotinate phosphoribosyltransferase n=1 Tax=Candidatus Contubernalis alkaliaceticus TaxID=338645 RepID=UPI001F4BDED6|nr:nicotinate phosphoribosyltransferase [Candidatus Contubernalis alkalaceticus]
MREMNFTMLADFYEFTMANGYHEQGLNSQTGYFDMFFRKNPDNGAFAIFAGTEQLIDYLKNLSFSSQDIEYLRGKNFSESFLNYLKDFKFSCDVWAVPEGTPVFPNEPLVMVSGPIIQAQLIETMLLLTVNHQSLIATKANRITRAAQGIPVIEFGSRRAQGYAGAVLGARASYIGGCIGTACTLVEKEYDIPVYGTMAHSWVQLFTNELDAFRAYARTYPANCVFLVDTYNVLKSGVPNAIRVFKEEVVPKGFRPKGIRIDSGDIAYLSKEARTMLDEAGFQDCAIMASNSLDEEVIGDLISRGARLDILGVGENLITAKSDPVFGGVYKLVAVEDKKGNIVPKIKLSENQGKIITPCPKQVYRLFDRKTNKAIFDVIILNTETIDNSKSYQYFSTKDNCMKKISSDFYVKKLAVKILEQGKCIYKSPHINSIRDYCLQQVDNLREELLELENPQSYHVNLSPRLWAVKNELIKYYSL